MLPNHSSSVKDRAGKEGSGNKAATESIHWGLFHNTSLGSSLIETLNTLVDEKKLTKEAAKVVLDTFDETIEEDFQTQVSQYEHSDLEITAEVLNYNCLRSDWRIDAKDVTIEMGAESLQVDDIRFLFRTNDK
mmetsp:Transcript_24829/g.42033  ORF Transcript_24829/g.42033 Transcript_24829/m.42033 type:complete len:133 (-) Transcript_24829:446-844(-)